MQRIAYQYRGWIAGGLGLLAFLVGQGQGSAWILWLLPLAIILRIWARQYIGSHSRGYQWQVPRLAVGGPYGWTRHPLYLSNVLMGFAIAAWWIGWQFSLLWWSLTWIFWFGFLARQEDLFLCRTCGIQWLNREGQTQPERSFLRAMRDDLWTWLWLTLILLGLERLR